MMTFTGALNIRLIEAVDLKPTDYSMRHGNVLGKSLDPYVSVDCDEHALHKSNTKFKSVNPVFNECLSSEVIQGQFLCLTVFHDSAIPPDDFVAHCIIPFEEILTRDEKDGVHDLWASFFFTKFKFF